MRELLSVTAEFGDHSLIASRSFKNCHVKGLHSFVLAKEPYLTRILTLVDRQLDKY